MKHPFLIDMKGKLFRSYSRYGKVRPSLPYQGIARRASNSSINYDITVVDSGNKEE
jgi:hypothetical protein